MGQKVNPIGMRLGVNRTWSRAMPERANMRGFCTKTSKSAIR